ncbi:MAG: hypothetical protein IPK68_02840 [Bdellovibrionales bacterium]|nr:hypothetical protein [Bdellovibrionales bacterium]
MRAIPLGSRILLGRLLTRSGDQAWNFAIPLVLLQLLPSELRIAALYYLLVKIATALFLPLLARKIDHVDRLSVSKFSILSQLIGVLMGYASIFALVGSGNHNIQSLEFILIFGVLVSSGIIGELGSIFMDISIANDLAPSSFSGDVLSKFNSRFRQVDLFH